MNDDDTPLASPTPGLRPDPTKLQPTLGHLLIADTRTPDQRSEAQAKEADRRAGRKRGKWWEKPLL